MNVFRVGADVVRLDNSRDSSQLLRAGRETSIRHQRRLFRGSTFASSSNMKKFTVLLGCIAASLLISGCTVTTSTSAPMPVAEADGLTGAWRSKIQFTTGSFAAVKDLEFMYVFNAGGTMTESSNYDA